MSPRATAALLTVGCVWGASFLFIRVAINDGLAPVQIVLVRGLSGAIILNVIVLAQRRPFALRRSNLPPIVALSMLGTVLPFLAITWAETEIDSGPAAVLNATMPVFTTLFAAVFLADERLSPRTVAGVGLGLAGAAILTGSDVFRLGEASTAAQLAVVAASASYGASAVLVRILVRRNDSLSLSAASVTVAAVALAAIAAIFQPPTLEGSASAWGSMLALGVLGTGVAYVFYYWLIENVGSVRASLVTYVIPVVGVALGAIVLHEAVRWNTYAGGGVIALGVGVGTGGFDRGAGMISAALRRRAPAAAAAVDAGAAEN